MYSAGFDKFLCRFEEEKEVVKVTLPNKALCLTANDTHVFVLTVSSDVLIIDARDLTVKSNKKLNFDATALEVCGS